MIERRDQESIVNYLADASNFKGNCEKVLVPASKDEVKEAIIEAAAKNIPVTFSGAGTGLTGGRVPLGGWVISTEKLNRIIDIDTSNKTAAVEPGLLLSDFHAAISKIGLYYPPDPTEQNSTIGGNFATNASGAKSYKYGPTRSFIESAEIILPSGETFFLPQTKNCGNLLSMKSSSGKEYNIPVDDISMPEVKNASGYYIKRGMRDIDLFIGSEGTLGFVSEISLRLMDIPNEVISAVIFFESDINALDFIDDLRSLRNRNISINPSALEFFDKNSLEFLREDFPGIPNDALAAVWLENDCYNSDPDKVTDVLISFCEKHKANLSGSWFASDAKDRNKFQTFRHAVSYKVSEFISSKNMLKVGTDTAVPVQFFRKFLNDSINLVSGNEIRYVLYGHFGDCHMHLNMLPENQDQLRIAREIYSDIIDSAIEAGGTVSAEHGIGKIKKDYLLRMYGFESIKKMAYIKKILDSENLFGRGNIFTDLMFE